MLDRLLTKMFGKYNEYHDTNGILSDNLLTADSIVFCDLLCYPEYTDFNVVLTIDKKQPFEKVHTMIQDRKYTILNNNTETYYHVIVQKN